MRYNERGIVDIIGRLEITMKVKKLSFVMNRKYYLRELEADLLDYIEAEILGGEWENILLLPVK